MSSASGLVSSGREQQIDFRHLKSSHGDVELGLDIQKVLQLDREDGCIPSCVFRELVIGDYVGSNLFRGSDFQPDRWDLFHTSCLAASTRPWPAMMRVLRIDENRVGEAKYANAPGDLPDLVFRMCARIEE